MKAKSLLMFLIIGLVTAPKAYSASDGQSLLQQLIKGARKEGQLDIKVVSAMGEKGARELTNAFKKRFDLGIAINADISGRESRGFSKAIVETKSDITPTFDLLQGSSVNIIRLRDAGGADPIDNWGPVLAEIAPKAYKVKDEVSPPVIAGYGFLWATRLHGLVYNPKLISERELPRTYREMGNPKYAGAFSVPPFISTALKGILKYEKEEWLEILRSLGRSKTHVLVYQAGVERMILGDIKFLEASPRYYFQYKSKDPNVPIGITFFEDYTALDLILYVLRKGARHPNAAKLFALWAASAEANRIFEKYSFHGNLPLGTGSVTQKIQKLLKERKIKPVSWLDNPKNLKKFRWLATKEGQQYSRAVAKAQREGR